MTIADVRPIRRPEEFSHPQHLPTCAKQHLRIYAFFDQTSPHHAIDDPGRTTLMSERRRRARHRMKRHQGRLQRPTWVPCTPANHALTPATFAVPDRLSRYRFQAGQESQMAHHVQPSSTSATHRNASSRKSSSHPKASAEITDADIERALGTVARVIELYGDVYFPILRRLEAELHERRAKRTTLQKYLTTYWRRRNQSDR